MTDLPLSLRGLLTRECHFSSFLLQKKVPSATSNSCKYLFALEGNTIIESVFMEHKHGNSLCVSTQAGCRMGCAFCASAVGGLERSLTAGEMAAQVYATQKDSGKRVDYVVLMGCGEPLDNLDHCLRFLALVSHPKGLNIGLRHITVSTCGLVKQIYELAKHQLPITLAVSLHATDDVTRRRIMPVAKRYTIQETLQACAFYTQATHRRVTYEYALIDGLNDTDAQAHRLAALLKGQLCHVNLMPVNTASHSFLPGKNMNGFKRILSRHGIPATVRRSLGDDIDAACGQLRKQTLQAQSSIKE
jgi:23S rRNA (adenine2503-C2)-methyltransferase